MDRLRGVGRLAAAIAAVGLITFIYSQLLQVNPTTVALSYLVAILVLATRWGLVESTAASIAALLAFNFFFLPPIGTFTIADPQNWVAFVAFLLTAIIASQMSGRARQREIVAASRQRDLERLYALSRALLLSERGTSMPGAIARHIADIFELKAVGVYDQRTDRVSWAGSTEWPHLDDRLREIARRPAEAHEPGGLLLIAIQLGSAPIGSLALTEVGMTDTVLRSIANLAAIGLERARADEATARAEASRESSELRATLLDALAHEFKTPLTTMKVASSDLRGSTRTDPREAELVAIIDEELDRLGGLVTDAIQMLRIDAGDFTIHLQRQPLAAVVSSALRAFERRLEGHAVVKRVPDTLVVDADADLLGLALRLLLDNALKYSPSTSTIEIVATNNGTVDIAVRNTGSLIPEREQTHLFDRFYRGADAHHIPGTGMGLTIVSEIVRAHRGTLRLTSMPGDGTTLTLSLPREGIPS